MENYSVLMTMYKKDNPDYAKIAIDSMLNQTLKTNDFVLVCDGPLTEELNALIEIYEKEYPSAFHVVRFEENKGLGAALRYGVTICKNDLIARMDDDDIAKLNRCEIELNVFMDNPDISIVGAYMNEFEENPNEVIRVKKVPLHQDDIVNFSKRRNPFNHSTIMFKKEDILKVGNYSEMRTNQDVDLWVRALNKGLKTKNIPESLVDFRFDAGTYQRRKNWKNVKLLIEVWKEFYHNGYCGLIDLLFVIVVQVVMFVFPKSVIEWCYNHLR